MFIEYGSDGWIAAAYLEEQYPGQKWVPVSDDKLQGFLAAAPRLTKDDKGRRCLRPASFKVLPFPRRQSKQLATAITVALYEYSPDQPIAWSLVGAIAEEAGILRHELRLALVVADTDGLLRVQKDRWAMLTETGRKAAELHQARSGDLGRTTMPVEAEPPTPARVMAP